MLIKIEDTGLVNPDFTSSDIPHRFPTFESLTNSVSDRKKKQNGEFRASLPVILKVSANNNGIGNNFQLIPSNKGIVGKGIKIGTNPVIYNFTATLEKPVLYSEDLKDLELYKQLKIMTLSQGHKDLHIVTELYEDEDKIMTFYQDMELFGKTDIGSPSFEAIPKKHLNLFIRNVSINESSRSISYNLDCLLYIGF